MGRALVFILIAGVAGVMGWFAVQPECAGKAVASQESCEVLPGLSTQECAAAFNRARRDATVYPNRDACERDGHAICDLHVTVIGFTPRPEQYCVAREESGTTAAPIYRKRGQAVR
jgi:hypothetical protein